MLVSPFSTGPCTLKAIEVGLPESGIVLEYFLAGTMETVVSVKQPWEMDYLSSLENGATDHELTLSKENLSDYTILGCTYHKFGSTLIEISTVPKLRSP
jgi:hypothetical protein